MAHSFNPFSSALFQYSFFLLFGWNVFLMFHQWRKKNRIESSTEFCAWAKVIEINHKKFNKTEANWKLIYIWIKVCFEFIVQFIGYSLEWQWQMFIAFGPGYNLLLVIGNQAALVRITKLKENLDWNWIDFEANNACLWMEINNC